MLKQAILLGLGAISLAALSGCGGGGGTTNPPPGPAVASAIVYTNPVGVPATAFSLTRNAALSTPGTHLVLDLYGPANGVMGSGVVITLSLDSAKAAWSPVPAANGAIFVSNPQGAPIVKTKVTGGSLQVVVTEHSLTTPKALNGALLQVALDLKPDQSVGSTISLSADLAKSQVLLGTVSPMADLRIGTLTIQ